MGGPEGHPVLEVSHCKDQKTPMPQEARRVALAQNRARKDRGQSCGRR